MPRRLGILGGTFDPPHIGHLLLAESAREQLSLDQVIFMPSGVPPHKLDEEVQAASARLAMVEMAVADHENFTSSRLDIDRPPPHHTVTLIPLVRELYPYCRIWFLLGSDSLRDLPVWYQPQTLIAEVNLAVLARPGLDVDWEVIETAVPGTRAATTMIDGPSVAVSSRQIRTWAAAGRSLRYLLPTAVRDFITSRNLYRS